MSTGIHSVTLIVHLLSRLLSTWPCPSVFAFSYAPDNICHTTLFPDSSLYSFYPWGWLLSWFSPSSFEIVTSFSSWVLLSDQVSQPYVITGSIHSLNAFLFSLIGTFLSRMMLSSLQNALHPWPILLFISCIWSWSLVIMCPRYT